MASSLHLIIYSKDEKTAHLSVPVFIRTFARVNDTIATIMRNYCLYLLLFLFSLRTPSGFAAPSSSEGRDSIRFSLLTCAAGEEIYSLFGHTAIRYENITRGIDLIFNYGVFDFDTPNFVMRFALGETDYQLGINDYQSFVSQYAWMGRDIWEQVLNLRPQEKERLIALLQENYKPQNRIYRYNFFYDNCATRPRDLIEKAIDGSIQYADDMNTLTTDTTFRDILHTYSTGHPWSRFGMDLCMGPKADLPISRRTMMFVPFYLQEYFGQAQIKDNKGELRPLVLSEAKILDTHNSSHDNPSFDPTPQQLAWLLLILITAVTAYGAMRRKSLWGIDLILFLAAGVAGCILAFLALFSQHPAVSPNYLLFVFHPLHLLCLPCMLKQVRKKRLSKYMMANLAVLTFFILLWAVIPQRFDFTVLPLALCLLVRSVNNLIIYKTTR